MISTRRFLIAALLAAISFSAEAQRTDLGLIVAELQRGGLVIVFRHGATFRDQADTDPLNLDNVAKQRQLNDAGRVVARQVGESMKKLRIPIGKVYTSQFNRAVETGKLIGGGEVVTSADITEGGLVVTPIENDRRTEALRKLAGTAPDSGTNTIIVSHKPNIMDAFGKDWFDVREGEATICRTATAAPYWSHACPLPTGSWRPRPWRSRCTTPTARRTASPASG
jgi:phosphohistidine phosphatase SixA